MRPVDKGPWPTRKNTASTKLKFNDWTRAIKHLRVRTGEFCHLCEMAVDHLIAVEHIKSRHTHPKLSSSWTNFLLSCSHCNSSKSTKLLDSPYRKHYFWPHIHNTLMAFEVPLTGDEAGVVRPSCNVTQNPQLTQRARDMIALYELNKTTTADGAADRRYLNRMAAIQMATSRRVEFEKGQATIAAILDLASKTGFFSVWFEIFSDVPEVKSALIGAPKFCLSPAWFDANSNPIPRTAHDVL